jgi:hypothetical protein
LLEGETVATTEEREELPLVVFDRAGAMQFLQFVEWVGADRWTEPKVDELHESSPRHIVEVPFQCIISFSHHVVHVQGCQPNLIGNHGMGSLKIGLAMVKPGQWIRLGIITGKVELPSVERVAEIVLEVVVMQGVEVHEALTIVATTVANASRHAAGVAVLSGFGEGRCGLHGAIGVVQKLIMASNVFSL